MESTERTIATSDCFEMQPGETAKSFAAFCAYRDLGIGRSVDGAYHKTGAKPGQNDSKISHENCREKRAPAHWWEWSSKHQWRARADAYDAEQDRRTRQAMEAVRRDELRRFQMQLRADNEQFAQTARVSMSKALESMEKLGGESLSARDAAALLHAATVAIKTANEIQAQALGLDELVHTLGD